jgi:ketosteroid isomerase-like protein
MVSHRPPVALPLLGVCLLGLILAGCASNPPQSARASRPRPPSGAATAAAAAALQKATAQVIATERAFAATMANRDFKSFMGFLSADAVFYSGSTVERGATPIAQQWAPYFRGAQAPFAWRPDDVQVLDDGRLALSTGPVTVAGQIVGRYNSVWRLEAPNSWRIVFDKGEAVCSTTSPPPASRSNGNQFFQGSQGN